MGFRVIEKAEVPSVGEDMLRSIPTGLAEGVSYLTGTLGDIGGLARSGVDAAAKFAEKQGFGRGETAPTMIPNMGQVLNMLGSAGAQITGQDPKAGRLAAAILSPAAALEGGGSKEVLSATTRNAPLYQPQTKPGKYVRTVAQFAPAAATPGSAGRRLANVLVPSLASEAAGQATEGSPIEPYARTAAALVGGGVAQLAGRPGPDTRMLAEATRAASDDQIAAARQLMETAQGQGVRLTMAEALQQVTNGGTGMGRMQRVLEGTRAGNERIAPAMAERPGQVRAAVAQFADTIAPPVDNPSMVGAQAREAAGGALDDTRRFVNWGAQPHYDRLPGQSLPDESFQQLADNPSFQAALKDVRGNPELAPLLQADLPMDEASRMLRAQQQGFTVDAYHGTPVAFDGDVRLGTGGNTGPHAAGAIYAADNPAVANSYARGENPAVYPLRVRPDGFPDMPAEDFNRLMGPPPAQAQGAPGMMVRNTRDYSPLPVEGPTPEATTIAAFDPARVRSRFDAFAPPNPDNDLNVINRIVQRLDEMAESATPSPANPGGSNTLAAQRGKARSLADALASEASPDWRAARDGVRAGRAEYLEPLQRGPLGAVSKTDSVKAQTAALFPAQPLEGAPAETTRALEMLATRSPEAAAGLTRQHLINALSESTQDNLGGPNQWGGAKFAAQVAGNPEQQRTLQAGVEAVGGDLGRLDSLVEVLRATGRRERPGSMTAYNARDLEELGKAGALGEVARTGLNAPGVFRRLGQGFQDWQTERNAGRLAEAILANPADAERIVLRAREVVPPGQALQTIEQLAIAASQSRQQQPQLEGR